MPNSAKSKASERRLSAMSYSDLCVLQELRDEGMVYAVPSGSNDDWYWM